MSEKYVESIITPLSDGTTNKQKYIIRDKEGRELISELTNDLSQNVQNINEELNKKVDKVTGKGLSTNDYTTAEKNKLAGIAAGAEVNVNADWNATSGDAQILNKPTTISGYGITDAYTKTQVDGLVSGVLHYKGTKTTISALPTSGNKIGDVWHITADGSEHAWDGSAWQELGTATDLSAYYTSSQIDGLLNNKVTTEAGKGLSTNDYTTAEKNKLAGIAVGAQVNVQADWNTTATSADSFIKNKPSIPSKTSDLTNDSGFITAAEAPGLKYVYDSQNIGGVILNSTTNYADSYAVAAGTNTTASHSYAFAEGSGTLADGMYSHAEGGNTTAQAIGSHAEGYQTYADGSSAHAEGYNTTAMGPDSHAEGQGTIAAASQGHAEGLNTSVSGFAGHAEGTATTAMTYAHAEGKQTLAQGESSHAEGYNTKATGAQSHAQGYGTTASGTHAHAEGVVTTASGAQSHAEGCQTTASGTHAHAEGVQTLAGGSQTHAEGIATTAANIGAHSEGNHTLANGYYSHAEGDNTIANCMNQHVFGQFNEGDPSTKGVSSNGTYIEIVGNGTATTARSNARILDWSGNEWLAGNSTVAGGNLTLGSVTITEPTNDATQFLNATGGWSVPAGGSGGGDGNTTYTLTATTGSNSTIHLVSGSSTVANITIPNTTNTTYGTVSSSANGLMSATDKIKLNALSTVSQSGTLSGTTGTDNYKVVLSKTASTATIPAASTSAAGVMTTTQVNKLNGIAASANNYTHPSYTAATGAPTANQSPGFGGTFSVNQVNRNATGHIGSLTNRTITIPSAVATTAANGLMSSTDKKKLDAMSTVDNNTTYDLSISTASNSTIHLISGNSTVKNITIPNTTNTTYGLATTNTNGLLSSYMYQALIHNAVGADESGINGINATNGYQIHLDLANLYTEDYLLEDYTTIPAATTATYGVVKPDGTATHFLNGTGGWTAPSGGTSYNTMSSAQMIAGTATTNRVINAANLTNYIKDSVVPIGSIRYTTTSAAPANFGTWTELWSMENFKTQLSQNESFWPAYCAGTSESVVFAVTIPHLSQAMSFNPQEYLPSIENDFGSGGSSNSFRYFNNQATYAVLNGESAGSSDLELYTRSVIGDTIRIDFRGYHNLWRTGTSGSSTYARPAANSVGMLRCSFLYIYNLPPCWCWIRTS